MCRLIRSLFILQHVLGYLDGGQRCFLGDPCSLFNFLMLTALSAIIDNFGLQLDRGLRLFNLAGNNFFRDRSVPAIDTRDDLLDLRLVA